MKPFDYVNDINFGKKDIMRGTANDDLAERDHNQYLTNKSLSYFPDTVLFANEMNIREMDNRLHFTFLLNVVRPKKRFSKWEKVDNSETIELIQRHYGYSIKKAEEVASLLTQTQVESIKNLYNIGG